MKSFVRRAAITLSAGAALMGQMAFAESETLKLAHFVSPAHSITATVIEPLQQGLKEATDGTLGVRVYPGGELGAGPAEQYVRALQGVADITWGLSGYTSSQFKKSMTVEMPGAIPEGMTGYEMLWNAYDSHLKSEFPGTKPLALWASEPSIFIMKDHEIRTPADLKGLKIRVSGAMTADLMKAFGATPVQMGAGEMYNALQTGLIDGIVTGASAIDDFKLDEVANSYTMGAPLGHIMFYLVMNQAKYDSLSDDHKAALDASTGLSLSRSGEEGWNQAAQKALRTAGADPDNTLIYLSEEEVAPFAAIADEFRLGRLKNSGTLGVLNAMQGK